MQTYLYVYARMYVHVPNYICTHILLYRYVSIKKNIRYFRYQKVMIALKVA